MFKPPLSQEQIDEIIRLRESGHTIKETAEIVGVGKTAVVEHGGRSHTNTLPKEKQDEIFRLRQEEHLSNTEISKRVGVSSRIVGKYGGPAIPESEKKRKSEGQVQARKNDAAIAEKYGINEEDITTEHRKKFTRARSNAKSRPYNKQLEGLSNFIERAYPEQFEEILKKSNGKNKSLTQILYHPIIRRDFGNFIDKAIENGLDLSSGRTKQGIKSVEALRNLRADMDGNLPSLIFGKSPKIRNDIVKHKAREFMYAAGRTGNPTPEDISLAGEWFDNLTPADKVDSRAPLELRELQNAAITTPEGYIDKNARRVYHHNYELGKGFPHTSNQNDFSIVSDLEHRRIHSDPAYTGRPPVGPPDPGFVRRTILNLKDIPGVAKAGKVAARALPFLGAAFDAQAASEYFSKGNEVLGILAGAQAVPVLGDIFGLPLAAAEGIGSIYNRDQKAQEERDRQRGLFGYTEPKRFRGFGGLLDY